MTKLEMTKMAFKHGARFVKKHLPTIMSIGAGVGVVATTYFTIKATPKAMVKIEEKKKLDPNLSKAEMIAIGGPEYRAAVVSALITEGLIFGANKINLNRIAGFGVLYSAMTVDKEKRDKALKAVEEVVGKEKVDEIKKQLGIQERNPETSAYMAEKKATGKEPPVKFGRNEKRPCICKLTGGKCINSYNGLVEAMEDSIEEAKTYGVVSLGDVLYRLKFPEGDIGSLLIFDKELDFDIRNTMVDGALGYEIVFTQDPMPDFDSELRRKL